MKTFVVTATTKFGQQTVTVSAMDEAHAKMRALVATKSTIFPIETSKEVVSVSFKIS